MTGTAGNCAAIAGTVHVPSGFFRNHSRRSPLLSPGRAAAAQAFFKAPLSYKMAAEERFDAVPTVLGGLGIVFGLHRADFSDPRQKSAVAAHEAVTRLFVDLDVVVDAHLGQQ